MNHPALKSITKCLQKVSFIAYDLKDCMFVLGLFRAFRERDRGADEKYGGEVVAVRAGEFQ